MTTVLAGFVAAAGVAGRVERRAWNYAILGFPTVVAGLVMLVLGRNLEIASAPQEGSATHQEGA